MQISHFRIGLIVAALGTAAMLPAQVGGQAAPSRTAGQQEEAPPQARPAAPPANAPATPNAAAPAPGQATAPATPARIAENGTFMMDNVSLTEMIDAIAKQLKINVILDP